MVDMLSPSLPEQREYRAGKGELAVLALAVCTESSLLVQIYGGAAHIGSVVWAEPRPSLRDGSLSCTSSTLNAPGHMDEAVARPAAERLARATGLRVVVAAGLHVAQATPDDIEVLCRNAEACVTLMLEKEAGIASLGQCRLL